jgi:hypothetical protein
MASKYQLKAGKNGKFYFHLLATNGKIILASEMYETRSKAVNGIESVRKNAAREGAIESLVASNGKPYFVIKSPNGQVVGKSQMYASTATRARGIASVVKNGPDAVLEDLTK